MRDSGVNKPGPVDGSPLMVKHAAAVASVAVAVLRRSQSAGSIVLTCFPLYATKWTSPPLLSLRRYSPVIGNWMRIAVMFAHSIWSGARQRPSSFVSHRISLVCLHVRSQAFTMVMVYLYIQLLDNSVSVCQWHTHTLFKGFWIINERETKFIYWDSDSSRKAFKPWGEHPTGVHQWLKSRREGMSLVSLYIFRRK